MNTQEVAKKWADMCRQGQNLECVNELYAENVTSREMPGIPDEVVSGKQNVWNKNKQWLDNVEEFHSGEVSDPVISGKHFTTKMSFDVTFKDKGRQQMEEVCVFEVKNGKIASEQFFYSM
jgi:hypothetical protein